MGCYKPPSSQQSQSNAANDAYLPTVQGGKLHGLGGGIPLNLKKDSMLLGGGSQVNNSNNSGKLPNVVNNAVDQQPFQIPSARQKQATSGAQGSNAAPSGQNSRLVRNASRGHAEGGGARDAGSNDRRSHITNKLITSSAQGSHHVGSMPLAQAIYGQSSSNNHNRNHHRVGATKLSKQLDLKTNAQQVKKGGTQGGGVNTTAQSDQ